VRLFSEALSSGDYESLTAQSTPRFREIALPDEAALQQLELLSLPSGEFEIDEIIDLDQSEWADPDVPEKLVAAKFGSPPRTIRYRVAKSGKMGRWAIDDIYVKQKAEGVSSVRSVTEQMALLLAASEFAQAWAGEPEGEHYDWLSDGLRSDLASLPAGQREALAKRIFDGLSRRNFKPEASIDDNVAVVQFTRPGGRIIISLKREDGADWLVDDLAFEDRENARHISSLRQAAAALRIGNAFLEGYVEFDRDKLRATATERFYEHCLSKARLEKVSLDAALAAKSKLDLDLRPTSADVIADTEDGRVLIALEAESADGASEETGFRVREVTLFSKDGAQERRLSSALTGDAVLLLFSSAVADGNLSMLAKTSTHDFRERVWSKVEPDYFEMLPLENLRRNAPVVEQVLYRGAVTEYLVMQGGVAATYLLIDQGGAVRVDDVQFAVTDRPRSLKQTLQHALPIIAFQQAIRSKDLNGLRRTCSSDFNRHVWAQMRAVPTEADVVSELLSKPMTSMEVAEEAVHVTYGGKKHGAEVTLRAEGENYLIDEVMAIKGPQPKQQANLKQTLKQLIAHGSLQHQRRDDVSTGDGAIVPVGFEQPAIDNKTDDAAKKRRAEPKRRAASKPQAESKPERVQEAAVNSNRASS